ncbi:hypothetical protein SDRG_00803 [Saprolegnia diclina VS20]|uniref:WW domain-containing protein n=1 Tax=Saprolegnia diclina (strain VS20) TaxID=1156394 RepID=T0S9M7_SAPDV|nr:hypothetical protein SDRG_00803 [Saprolegnia diclina VS20]EQC41953.1 hypothetical protein SDRG_00803 [Saprolegnia diclina VS20]|eukprot:XP_008604522.1 hypothetical protein SDRG_00803 [Saprolegnia diclina VS20]
MTQQDKRRSPTRLAPLPTGDSTDRLELVRLLHVLCAPLRDPMARRPYPSVADNVAAIDQGPSQWRTWAIFLVAQLKQAELAPNELKATTLLLLYYVACDATLAPTLVLEGLVPCLVDAIVRVHLSLAGAIEHVEVASAPCHPLHLEVAVDALRYSMHALVLDLHARGHVDALLPLGPMSLAYVLASSPIPRDEVDECLLRRPQPPAPSIFACAGEDHATTDGVEDTLASLIAQSSLFQHHLAVRTLVVLVRNITSKSHSFERRRLLDDGALQALVLAAALPSSNNPPNVPPDELRWLQAVVQQPSQSVVATLLSLSFVSAMAANGLADVPSEELGRVVRHQAAALLHAQGAATDMLHRRLLHDPTFPAAPRAHVLLSRLCAQRATAPLRPCSPSKQRVHANKALHKRRSGAPSCACPRLPAHDILAVARRAEDVAQSVVTSYLVVRDGLSPFVDFRAWAMAQPSVVVREKRRQLRTDAAANADRIRRAKYEADDAAVAREMPLMAAEDKPPESETERRGRLKRQREELRQWQATRAAENASRVQRLLQEKAEARERESMARADVRWRPLREATLEDPLVAEEERVRQLRRQLRETKLQQAADRAMRAEDHLSRLHRSHLRALETQRVASERAAEANARRQMRAEENERRLAWRAIAEKEMDDALAAKLAARKQQRADERRHRRRLLYPDKYSDWTKVPDGTSGRFYYQHRITGATQWETPEWHETPAPSWELATDANGTVYYINATTGESVWDLPPSSWTECTGDDGVIYFYNPLTGDSSWTRPT